MRQSLYDNTGKIWINKDDKEMMIKPHELKKFIKNNWKKGRLAKSVPWDNRNKINISDFLKKLISDEDFGNILLSNWDNEVYSRPILSQLDQQIKEHLSEAVFLVVERSLYDYSDNIEKHCRGNS